MVNVRTTYFRITKHSIVPTLRIFVLRRIIAVNSTFARNIICWLACRMSSLWGRSWSFVRTI